MKHTIYAAAIIAVVALSACASSAPAAEAPATDAPAPTVPATTEAPVTVPPTTEAPATTEAASPAFLPWLLSQSDEVAEATEKLTLTGTLAQSGDVEGAADAAEETGTAFYALYLQAPEDGTPLSDVSNEMFRTCGTAYSGAAVAMRSYSADALTASTAEIAQCTALLNETTEAMPG
jgi:hypothetical protein